MDREQKFPVLILIVFATFVFATNVSAFTIETLDEPYSMDVTSGLENSTRIVNVTNDGNPVDKETIVEGFNFYYTYDSFTDQKADMEHLSKSYWYTGGDYDYTDVIQDVSDQPEINYFLNETTGTRDTFNSSENFTVGNYSIELLSDKDSSLPPGETANFRINITDKWNNEPETGATANIYFTNGSYTHKIQDLGNQEGSEYYNNIVDVPDVYDGRYLVHINVSNPDDPVENSNGSFSMPVKTEPPMEGEILSLESDGCEYDGENASCERESDVYTEYSTTGETPIETNLHLNVYNRSSGEWQERISKEMDNDSGIYSTEFNFPDLNTSEFGNEVQLVYNATGEETSAVETLMVDVAEYRIRFGASSSGRQGGSYNLELGFEGEISSRALPREDFDAQINVYNTSEDETTYLENFTLEDMDFNSGIFQRDVEIGSEWSEGRYSILVNAENAYGANRTSTDDFYVQSVNRTFNLSGEIEETRITGRNYTEEFRIENIGTSEIDLYANYSDDLENITFLENKSSIHVEGEEELTVQPVFNMTGREEVEGEITVSDVGFNESLDVEFNLPECDYRQNSVCVEALDDLNISTDENGDINRSIRTYYIASEESQELVSSNITGNISDTMSIDPESAVMNSSNNQMIQDLSYTVSGPGYYSGSINLNQTSVPVELQSTAEAQEITFETDSSIDLGTIAGSETLSYDLEVENTGSMPIQDLEFESDEMTLVSESIELSAGETDTVELEISEVESSGTITATASNQQYESTDTIDVSADVIPDYIERASTLRERIDELQSQNPDSESQNTLNTASLNVSEIENAYQAGNYDEAESVYEATDQKVSQVRSDINSQEPETSNQPEEPPAPGETDTDNEQDSGNSIIILAVVMFLLLVIGFIAYTSLIPEEGDPLYGVLGE